MDSARRMGAALIAWLAILTVSVVLPGGAGMYLGAIDVQHEQRASESSATVRHEHGEADRSEDCHPGMTCSLSAIGTQRKDPPRTQRASDLMPVTVACVADRFTPVYDPPPPRQTV